MLSRDHFLIRDDVVFLNHGSFGACPKPVFEQYQQWQLELERQPIEFLGRRREGLMREARDKIADYLNVPADEVSFVTNATMGLNTVFRSLELEAGDEILTTTHEYGALEKTMAFVCKKSGATITRYQVDIPYTTDEAFVDALFEGVTGKTKVIFFSHITSPSALIFPAAKICQRAREMGIFTIIDGAHATGQIPLDLTAIGADAYSGNFHKWLCAPKGSAFLHVRKEHHQLIDPHTISHGWYEGADYFTQNEWQGTRDIAAFLSVPSAIDFQAEHDWEQVRADCHELAAMTQSRLCDNFGLEPLSQNQFAQMVTIPLPECDLDEVKERLYEEFHIEVPVTRVNDKPHIRVSYQAYNSAADAQALVDALMTILG